MKTKLVLLLISFLLLITSESILAQEKTQGETIHLSKLELNKKQKKTFQGRDSILTLTIDTLIMKDKSTLQFFGKKEVNLIVKQAYLGKDVAFYGQGIKNNGTNFNIDIDFDALSSLYIFATGQNAMNGSKTFPNGDGGNVTLTYTSEGFEPQTTNKKEKHYIRIENTEGGLNVVPTSDVTNIYSRIAISGPGLRGLPQGQIYSGSPGKKGTITITKKNK